MNITRENTGELTSTVRIAIDQKDYEENVAKVLKDYQHKANIPGFRPGKVPIGMIKKMYGKAIVADEINKLISDAITNYIDEEKLDILGSPIANPEKNKTFDFDTQKDFEFYFDIGIAPAFEVKLDSFTPTERYTITIDDKMVERYLTDTRKRFGTVIHPEKAEAEDMLEGEVTEVDAEGQVIADGAKARVLLDIPRILREKSRKILTGLTKDSKLVIKPLEFFETKEEALKVLNIPEQKITAEGIAFELTVNDVNRVEPSEMNKDFFRKVFPGKEIETEEEFTEQVRKEASASFTPETDKLFFRQASDKILHETNIPLPDEFIKRWLLDHQENKLKAEDMEKEYPFYSESMRWQLVENKLLREHNIRVEDLDIREYIQHYFLSQIPMNMEDPEAAKRMESLVDVVMKNKEQVRKINDDLYTNRLLELFKTKIPVEEKEISFDEFANLASAYEHQHHQHDHDHTHDHDHEGHHLEESDHEHHHKH